ncbi:MULTISPECIES: phosphoribosylamine--glycine ligase [Asticcacaulis]|uniref:phosphoribosylamine--glycine ligase n=1 Tax=Asticcacaulis TaxID=76890 RepID=UPI001AE37EF8|nr:MULTISPECIES: phosphoribosylamine--glycine ligase [Asticcacaulis]MBP2160646.1 phosphoribosylamine--glycine ligase [Asticcacaulis solisilvae]MDR6801691.1 phosphoribosylamine--glycine ligase [Asticcacaulis sp. BE141]
MNILLIGSGGREHALAWKIRQSPLCERLVIAPGNPGMAALGECHPIKATDVEGLTALAREIRADLVVVGPESALAEGIADACKKLGIPCFGPMRTAAQLESSKAFTKDFCKRHNIPTAASETFTTVAEARDFLKSYQPPYVIKADGLAAGKGVAISPDYQDAVAEIEAMLGGRYGPASSQIVIEEFMTGEEASVFALCDGETALLFGWAQDHKRAFDGDTGPNTGGMGTYSPAPIVTPDLLKVTETEILKPTMAGMKAEGNPYTGVLYAGLMIEGGRPRLVEYNARFGDPECQVLMLRLKSDIVPYLVAATKGGLKDLPAPQWHDEAAVCVVYAAKGYPDSPLTGSLIRGADQDFGDDVTVFHAGTVRGDDGALKAAGGRVLNICARGKTIHEARDKAYAAINQIDWPGGFYRTDIGWRAL